MNPHVAVITLGVRDLERARRFYSEGLGWPIHRVDEVLAEAERAGATITKHGKRASWGGYSGYFADTDGYLWEVATGATQLPFSE